MADLWVEEYECDDGTWKPLFSEDARSQYTIAYRTKGQAATVRRQHNCGDDEHAGRFRVVRYTRTPEADHG